MKPINFSKVCGAGNDFIVIDNRNKLFPADKELIASLCKRKRSIGADGVMLLEPGEEHDFRMRIFNADGSEAEMCGNGARCITWFAYVNDIAKGNMSIATRAGEIKAQVIEDEWVELKMSEPQNTKLNYIIDVEDNKLKVNSINTGVPHVVVMVDNVQKAEVAGLGRKIRYHHEYEPAGTNVNFVSLIDKDTIAVRTYERGVEDETLACGTGAVAAALISFLLKKVGSQVKVKTKEDDTLGVSFTFEQDTFKDVYLSGPAKITYTGELSV